MNIKNRFRFRAWDKTENAYIEDAQFTYDDGCEGGVGSFRHYSFRDLLRDESCVVEQCTGLKDRDQKLIYEGDVLEFDISDPIDGGHGIGHVCWTACNEFIGWSIVDSGGRGFWDIRQIAHPNSWMVWGKVIGNIHEINMIIEEPEPEPVNIKIEVV